MYETAVDLEGPNLPAILGVTRENALDKIGGVDQIVHALLVYGLCPVPLFPEHVYHWLALYNSTDGARRLRTPAEYYALPAVWLDVCQVIDAERSRLAKARESKEGTRVIYGE